MATSRIAMVALVIAMLEIVKDDVSFSLKINLNWKHSTMLFYFSSDNGGDFKVRNTFSGSNSGWKTVAVWRDGEFISHLSAFKVKAFSRIRCF